MPKAPFSYLVLPLRLPIKTLAWLTMSSMYAQYAHASTVRDDVDYQLFRDFAENKGQFKVGAKNIMIYDRDGKELGEVLGEFPMPDFSVISRNNGVATLVDTQYVASVQHNGGYQSVQFGDHSSENSDAHHFDYKIVERNLALPINQTPRVTNPNDYHAPRLHKLVTEVAPIASTDHDARALTNGKRYTAMARAGSGVQNTINKNFEKNNLTHAYQYLTGGTALPKNRVYQHSTLLYTKGIKESIFDNPMNTALETGDSGSGLLVWDAQKQQWLYGGSAQSASDGFNVYIAKGNYVADKAKKDRLPDITATNSVLTWTPDQQYGSTISFGGETRSVPLFNPTLTNTAAQNLPHADNQQLNHGKTLTIKGDGNTLQLTDTINQGAGAIYFDGDTTVKSDTDASWQGAGVVVAPDKTVNWQIKNPKGDRLSKLGKGTLKVAGTGINQGDISVGDGVVILNQQADKDGNKQAFNSLGIVSGRGTVVVGDNTQMDWDKLYFGFRGGRLDTNGQAIEFNRIANVDEGAQIVNHKDSQHKNSQATVTIKGNKPADNNKPADKLTAFNGFLGENDPNKGDNGKLDVTFAPHIADASLLLTGGSNINGTLSATGGTLMLSGRPTPHAYNHQKRSEVIIDGDWQNRTFKVADLNATNNAQLIIGRNVLGVTGNLNASHTAQVKMGFDQGDNHCLRSDRTGQISCATTELSNTDMASWQRTQFTGDANLNDESQVTIGGKTDWQGKLSADDNTTLRLNNGSHWTLTGNSTAGNLHLDNATITLNPEFDQTTTQAKPKAWNLLKIGSLSGTGQINYLSDVASKNSDKIEAKEATGEFKLFVKDTGDEPSADRLSLFKVENKIGELTIKLSNANEVVDKGTYQYHLIGDDNGDYRLYNPLKEQEIQQAEQERLKQEAEAKRKAEEAERLKREEAEAKRRAEEAERQKQAEQERLKQEAELERQRQLAKEQQQAEQARIEAQEKLAKAERLEHERQEAERKLAEAQQKAEQTKQKQQDAERLKQAEQAKLEAQKQAQLAQQKAEQAKLEAQEKLAEAERLKSEEAEQARLLEAERQAQAEQVHLEAERLKQAEQAKLKAQKEQLQKQEQAQLISRNSNTALSEASNHANLLADLGALDAAILKEQQPWAVWVQRTWQIGHHSSAYHRDYQNQQTLDQIGINTKQGLFDFGLTLVQAQGNANYEGTANKTRASDVNLYGKYTSPTGTAVAMNAGTSLSKSLLGEVAITRQSPHFGAVIAHTWQGNIAIRPYLGARVYVEPASSYTLAGSRIHTQKNASIYSYAGLSASKAFDTPYGRIHSSFATHMDNERQSIALSVNDRPLQHKTHRTFTHRLGLGAELGNYVQINASLGYRHGADIKSQSDATVRLEYRW